MNYTSITEGNCTRRTEATLRFKSGDLRQPFRVVVSSGFDRRSGIFLTMETSSTGEVFNMDRVASNYEIAEGGK